MTVYADTKKWYVQNYVHTSTAQPKSHCTDITILLKLLRVNLAEYLDDKLMAEDLL